MAGAGIKRDLVGLGVIAKDLEGFAWLDVVVGFARRQDVVAEARRELPNEHASQALHAELGSVKLSSCGAPSENAGEV